MPRYQICHSYRSFRDGQSYGPWEAGGVIDLSEADADWVNRDSPGTLALPEAAVEAEPDTPVEEPAKPKTRQQRPARDRQQRGGADRSI